MALKDDILALPSTVGEGNAGHLGNHATIHAGLKDHETRLGNAETNKADKTALDTRVPSDRALSIRTDAGTRILSGLTTIHEDTGWRDISTSLSASFTGSVHIRRMNDIVRVRLINVSSTLTSGTGGDSTMIALPAGFRHESIEMTHHLGGTKTQPATLEIYSNEFAFRANAFGPGSLFGRVKEFSFTASATRPPILPGLPV